MTRNTLSGSVRRPPARVALVLLVLLALGAGRPAPAAIVVQSMSVRNQVSFFGDITKTLEIGTTAPGQQADMVNFDEPPLSAMLAFQTTVPDLVGTSFSVRSLTKATVPEDGATEVFAFAHFSIEFEVDATQEYLLFVAEIDFGNTSPFSGGVQFFDLTAGTRLFERPFDDFGGEIITFTLEAGHVYRFEEEGDRSTFEGNSTGAEFVSRLSAVPEPSTWVGLGVGAAALLGTARRRRTSRITTRARVRG